MKTGMKKALILALLIILAISSFSQQNNSASTQVDPSYFVTHTREELITKLVALPCGIKPDDQIKVILQKIEIFLDAFQQNLIPMMFTQRQPTFRHS
jgi:hypothetical protein